MNAETGIPPILFGYTIKEVPVTWAARSPGMGVSKFRMSRHWLSYVKVFVNVMKIKYGGKKIQREPK